MNEPRPPDLAPLKTNDTAAILVGTGLWAVALVVLLVVGVPAGRGWWIWTCVAGIGLGLFGCFYVWRRDRHAPPPPAEVPGDDREDRSVPGHTPS
ncbi:DUF2530 domain-containing protein [Sphaerisporangium siamense]|uniref:DUF2530 domain-containing protein n=1 Tax=Sphaerisporangium siamense TaxID=795645 RepID=A0A7W7D5F4_9ACTN|nr:DUF2530 domain-containing protein [Sphaerisporangium siamense]MBB4700456.1 hypothetical protein [Sphaerisporangium siamense]